MLGINDNKRASSSKRGESKELQRLRRQDLLELLISQMHEGDDLRDSLDKRDQTIVELEQLVERLKDKLDLKDEQIENLKGKLDLKDEQISRLKEKLDGKDEQITHLKKRLDDKDASIAKLKHRLDAKDELVAHLIDGEMTADEKLGILDIRERALEAIEAEKSRRAEAAQIETEQPESESDENNESATVTEQEHE